MTMRFSKPIVGEVITVKCYDNRETFTGTVTPSDAWVDNNHFSMTSELPKYKHFPIRVIHLDRVDTLKYEKDIKPKKEKKVVRATHKVTGSSGNVYIVTQEGDVFHCTCPGHKWRNTCKHIKLFEGVDKSF